MIQLKKFTLREDWVPIKLDVSIEMPDVIDISMLRGSGLQPGEELLPELDTLPSPPKFDEAVLAQLQDMGTDLFFFSRSSSVIVSFLTRFSTWILQESAVSNW